MATICRRYGNGVGRIDRRLCGPHSTLTAQGRDDDPASVAAAPPPRAALLCNDAQLCALDGQWSMDGDPMKGAPVTLA